MVVSIFFIYCVNNQHLAVSTSPLSLGDPILRLIQGGGYPQSGVLVTIAGNDDFQGVCSMLEYDFSGTTECATYTAVQGCYEDSVCSGQTAIKRMAPYTRCVHMYAIHKHILYTVYVYVWVYLQYMYVLVRVHCYDSKYIWHIVTALATCMTCMHAIHVHLTYVYVDVSHTPAT